MTLSQSVLARKFRLVSLTVGVKLEAKSVQEASEIKANIFDVPEDVGL